MNPNLDWKAILALGAVGLVFYYVARREAGAVVTGVEKAINPVNPQNVFASAANAVTGAVTGTPSLGAEIYNITHPGS
jgi:hypothetical protein